MTKGRKFNFSKKKKATRKGGGDNASQGYVQANRDYQLERGLRGDAAHYFDDRRHPHPPRAPPVRLLDRHEILAITGVSYPTVWAWMCDGRFPRSREVGGRSMWLSSEIECWLANLPRRRLKGDREPSAAGPDNDERKNNCAADGD